MLPRSSTITRVTNIEATPQFTFRAPTSPVTPPPNNLKRRFGSSPRLRQQNEEDSTEKTQKRLRAFSLSDDSNGSSPPHEEESNGMAIDDAHKGKRHLQSERLKKVRANIEEARKLRREWYEQWKNKKNKEAETIFVELDQDTEMLDSENVIGTDSLPIPIKRKGSYLKFWTNLI